MDEQDERRLAAARVRIGVAFRGIFHLNPPEDGRIYTELSDAEVQKTIEDKLKELEKRYLERKAKLESTLQKRPSFPKLRGLPAKERQERYEEYGRLRTSHLMKLNADLRGAREALQDLKAAYYLALLFCFLTEENVFAYFKQLPTTINSPAVTNSR